MPWSTSAPEYLRNFRVRQYLSHSRRLASGAKPVQPPLVRTKGPLVVRHPVDESLPKPLHLARPVTQDTGSKVAILAFGGRGHAWSLSSIDGPSAEGVWNLA